MARKPKLRASYTSDARSLLRILEAVENDSSASASWKAKVVELCTELNNLLLQKGMKWTVGTSSKSL